MADFFVDQSIVGGNGTDPASAYASVLSHAWSAGDRLWLRKTHFETLTASQFLGCNSPGINGFSNFHWVIGWPDAGAPFYSERPARGVTVGWDADVSSSGVAPNSFGFNYPTIINSTGAGVVGMLLGFRTGIYNVCLANSPGTNFLAPWASTHGAMRDRILDNVFIQTHGTGLSGPGAKAWPFMGGKIIITGSGGAATGAMIQTGAISVKQLEVHSRAVWAEGLLPGGGVGQYGTIINWSSSINWLLDFTVASQTETDQHFVAVSYVERITGQRPILGVNTLGANATQVWRFDDYFGEGPRIHGGAGGTTRVCSSTEALHNSQPVVVYDITSRVGGTNFGYWDARWRNPAVRKYFSVISGTNVTVYLPIYTDSLNTNSIHAGQARAYLPCKGAGPVMCGSSNLIAGSYTNWAGSFVVAGSAWLFVASFTPKETGIFPYDFMPQNFFQASSGDGKSGYVLFGEPYAV